MSQEIAQEAGVAGREVAAVRPEKQNAPGAVAPDARMSLCT